MPASTNKWLIALTVMLPTLIEIIDTSVVNVSLNHIRGSLSAGIDESTWTITSYLVSNAVIIPMTSWLSRLFGRKNYLIASIILFTFSSFMCGSAWSLGSLVFFRVMQGVGGGALQPLSQSILLEAFPREQHGMATALFGMGIMFGPIIGPLLGGWITDNWSWRWIFYINVPIGILSIVMTGFVIEDPPYMRRTKVAVDAMGLAFLVLGLGSLQLVLDKGEREDWFSSNLVVAFAVISVVALTLLVINELYSEHPIIDLRLFKDRTFTAGNLVMFFAFFNLFATLVLLPIYLQNLMGYTAYLSGLVLGPGGIATMFTLPIVGRLVDKTSPKWILGAGIVLAALSTHLMSRFNLQAPFWDLVWPRVVLGIAMGCIFIPLTTMTLSHIGKEKMGEATGLYNLLRNIGGSVGVAVVTTELARRAQFHQTRLVANLTPFDPAYQQAKAAIAKTLSGSAAGGADSVIYRELLRQAQMLAFNDCFFFLSVLMLLILPLILLMKKSDRGAGPPAGMH